MHDGIIRHSPQGGAGGLERHGAAAGGGPGIVVVVLQSKRE